MWDRAHGVVADACGQRAAEPCGVFEHHVGRGSAQYQHRGRDRNMLENSLESPTTNECGAQNAPTLSSLPPEIILVIATHLRMDDTVIINATKKNL